MFVYLQQCMQQAWQRQVHQHHVKGPLNITLILQALRMLEVQAVPPR